MAESGGSVDTWITNFDRREVAGIRKALERIADSLDLIVEDKRLAKLSGKQEKISIDYIKCLISVHHVYRDQVAKLIYENQEKPPKLIFEMMASKGYYSKSTYWRDIKALRFLLSVQEHSATHKTGGV
ncbi:MAG: hypothetical protein ACK42H_12975 [Planctomycetota bacterium]|jgi:hypothetical protein